VITGFNTDIEHDGTIYHVQTEDKGLTSPIILSLVYSGGTILASKRAPYSDLIAQGYSDEALAERLKRQHRLICAAIHSGRIDDLKRMSPRSLDVKEEKGSTGALRIEAIENTQPSPVVEEVEPETAPDLDVFEIEETTTQIWLPPEKLEFEATPTQIWSPPEREDTTAQTDPESELVGESSLAESADVRDREFGESQLQDAMPEEDGLVITLLDDEEFNSGDERVLRVLVSNRSGENEKGLGNVAVSIKILGTAFRPLIYSIQTDPDGVAIVATQIPEFTSGRAAVLVRAVAKNQAAELRRIIHPGV
jgi:hypothetical protein